MAFFFLNCKQNAEEYSCRTLDLLCSFGWVMILSLLSVEQTAKARKKRSTCTPPLSKAGFVVPPFTKCFLSCKTLLYLRSRKAERTCESTPRLLLNQFWARNLKCLRGTLLSERTRSRQRKKLNTFQVLQAGHSQLIQLGQEGCCLVKPIITGVLG